MCSGLAYVSCSDIQCSGEPFWVDLVTRRNGNRKGRICVCFEDPIVKRPAVEKNDTKMDVEVNKLIKVVSDASLALLFYCFNPSCVASCLTILSVLPSSVGV